jgi:hypothetical protein
MTKRKTRSIEDEPDINLAEWVDASVESEADGGEAATGMASQPAYQRKNSKRTKLSGTNKRKQPDELNPNDVLLERIDRHIRAKRAVHIAARTRAANNKTVDEAMELQIDSSGGNKRKYALTEIKADIANKRPYVRRSLLPISL